MVASRSSVEARGGLFWGAPVRPDLLGQHLDAYQDTLAAISAFRLCHRFGKEKGPHVHVYKLPEELVKDIEDTVFESSLSYSPWLATFEHVESRCMPIDHLGDEYDNYYTKTHHELRDSLCGQCKTEDHCSSDCEEDCLSKVHYRMNEGMLGVDTSPKTWWRQDECLEEKLKWDDMTDRNDKGSFASYDKVEFFCHCIQNTSNIFIAAT